MESALQSQPTLEGWRKKSSKPSTLSDCAAIVPTYRRLPELVRLLDAMMHLGDVPAELIVVDGTPDGAVNHGLRRWAAHLELPFTLIYVSSPVGLTRQRNVGLDLCQKEFIFFLDDDTVPHPGYFAAIRQGFAADSDCKVGAIRGFLTDAVRKPVPLLWRLRHRLGIVPHGSPGQYHHCGTSGTWNGVQPFTGTREVDLLAGGAAAYRSEVFQKHRFSEFFHGYSQGEDFEMSLRLRRDWKLLVCGDAHIDHLEATNGRPPGFTRGRMVVRNRYFIWKRHSPRAGFVNCIRFWADQLLVIAYYSACFLARPLRIYYLAYATGTGLGLIECLVRPPRHEESVPHRYFSFAIDEFSETSEKVA